MRREEKRREEKRSDEKRREEEEEKKRRDSLIEKQDKMGVVMNIENTRQNTLEWTNKNHERH
jgi:hypothetical protein